MSFKSHTYPIARKSYKCSWCGEEIKKGDKYYKYVIADDSELTVTKLHIECDEAATISFEGCSDDECYFETYAQKRGEPIE